MKKALKAISVLIILILSLAALSCRNQPMVNYSYTSENIVAAKDWATLFDIYWHRMNTNYVFFDLYEADGRSWDAVYDEYYPRFEALGDIYETYPLSPAVTPTVLRKEAAQKAYRMFFDIVKDLHDGHYGLKLDVEYKESEVVPGFYEPITKYIYPDDYRFAKTTIAQSGITVADEDTAIYDIIIGNDTASDLYTKNSERRKETVPYAIYYSAANSTNSLFNLDSEGKLVWVPTTNTYDIVGENGTNMRYFRYDAGDDGTLIGAVGNFPVETGNPDAGNYVYFGFSDFSFYVLPEATDEVVDYMRKLVVRDDTKGVIIDLRGNGGGYIDDLSKLWSIFANGEDVKIGEFRRKGGDARTNYGPWTPFKVYNTSVGHYGTFDTKTPIAVLTNNGSVSCSEMSTLFFAALRDTYGYNVGIIGEHGAGGFGTLYGSSSELYFNGGVINTIAQINEVYTPYQELRYIDGVNYESKGYPVDGKEIPFNYDEFTSETDRKDAKLEAAIAWLGEQNLQ